MYPVYNTIFINKVYTLMMKNGLKQRAERFLFYVFRDFCQGGFEDPDTYIAVESLYLLHALITTFQFKYYLHVKGKRNSPIYLFRPINKWRQFRETTRKFFDTMDEQYSEYAIPYYKKLLLVLYNFCFTYDSYYRNIRDNMIFEVYELRIDRRARFKRARLRPNGLKLVFTS